jgi:dephospho-CoA kinase
MPKIIIGFVGRIASGKEVSKKYLEANYGAGSHRFSTMLRDILTRLYLPITRENLQNLSLDLRTRFGGDTLERVIFEDVNHDPQDIVIVDGIRRQDDIAKFKTLSNFYLISVETSSALRYARAVQRNENAGDDAKTLEQFLAEDTREAETEIPLVMASAAYQLNNDGTLADLYQQIDQIVAKIKKSNL